MSIQRAFVTMAAVCLIAGVLPGEVASLATAKEYDPHITYVFPPGGQRGTTLETIIRGRGLEGASEVRVSGVGVSGTVVAVEQPSTRLAQRTKNRQDQSENPNIVRVSVTIASEAPLGQRDLRLVTPKGITNRFRFIVGQIPEVVEIEPNSDESQAETLATLPVLVNGQIDQADRDIFRFTARAGETLLCEVQARKLLPYIADAVPGWLQSAVTLYDVTGQELKYVDDFRFHPDPLLIYQVEKDGEYLIEIRDVLFRGREDLIYRLSLGALPYITDIYPLGCQRGSTVLLQLFGVNLPQCELELTVPADSPPVRRVGGLINNSLASNTLPLAVGDRPESSEAEPNDTAEQANTVQVPVTVNGRIQQPGDMDYFKITVDKKQTLAIEVFARRLNSPTDSVLTILSAKGRELQDNDDVVDPAEQLITHHADSRLLYTFDTAGDYLVRVRDAQGNGGEEYSYRLALGPPRPDFALQVLTDQPRVGQGDSAVITVSAVRNDGFRGDIGLAVGNLPAGFVASNAVIPTGQNEVRLTVTAPPDAALALLSPTVEGTATITDKQVVRTAIPAERVMQAFIYYHNIPTDEFLMSVVHPPALTLSTNLPTQEVLDIQPGSSIDVVVKATRQDIAKAPVRLATEKPPVGITVKCAVIAADATETMLNLAVTRKAPVGLRTNIIITGTVKAGKETISAVAPAIPIRIIATQPQQDEKTDQQRPKQEQQGTDPTE